MQREGLGWTGWLTRLLAALFVVYATYNPEGYSYYHWVMSSVALPEAHHWYDSNALKFLVGVLLLTAWVVFLNATRNSLGLLGITLILAICSGLCRRSAISFSQWSP
ncbi:MAG: putative rane protein [Proteobacteria bacterium]|nr:putative rane protein [Pseudomonadota bacterium]